LLKGFNVDTAKLEAAIKAAGEPEGNRPNPESRCFGKFGRDLTEQAKNGKLDQ